MKHLFICQETGSLSLSLTWFVRRPNTAGDQRVEDRLLPKNTKDMNHVAGLRKRNTRQNDSLKVFNIIILEEKTKNTDN